MSRIEATNDFVVKFANVNGSGSASANELFARAILRMGVPVSPRNIFPSNIQGLPTLQAAGAEGAVGPVLDELKPDAARVAKALRNGLGQMPSYKDKLTDAEIEALSLYVSKASGGAK